MLCINSIRLEKQLLLESLLVLLKVAIMHDLDINAYDLHAMVMTAMEVFSERMANGLAQFHALSAW